MRTTRPTTAPAPEGNEASVARKKVLIIDDHQMVREGLSHFINQSEDLIVCGEAEDAQQGHEQISRVKPDVVLVDISLPGTNGIEFIKTAISEHPKLPIVVVSMHDESLYAERSLRAGALAYVMKRDGSDEVLKALRKALAGELYVSGRISAAMFRKLIGRKTPKGDSSVSMLSDRELEVFEQIGRGRTTRKIAEDLQLSIKTVDSHRAHIKDKLQLHSATELVQHAVRYIEHEFVQR